MGAALMILFVLLVEWIRQSKSSKNDAQGTNHELDDRASRPNTGELDF